MTYIYTVPEIYIYHFSGSKYVNPLSIDPNERVTPSHPGSIGIGDQINGLVDPGASLDDIPDLSIAVTEIGGNIFNVISVQKTKKPLKSISEGHFLKRFLLLALGFSIVNKVLFLTPFTRYKSYKLELSTLHIPYQKTVEPGHVLRYDYNSYNKINEYIFINLFKLITKT